MHYTTQTRGLQSVEGEGVVVGGAPWVERESRHYSGLSAEGETRMAEGWKEGREGKEKR